MSKKVVIIGVGSGLGKSLATKFAQEGNDLILIARQKENLEKIAAEVNTGVDIQTYTADVTDEADYARVLTTIQQEEISGFIYNVGITAPDNDSFTRDDLEKHFQADVAGAYQTVVALHDNLVATKGFALFTGGIAGVTPFPGFMGLSVAKAGLRNMVQLINTTLKTSGIFAGTITVGGVIKSGTYFAPDLIAEKFVELAQERNVWEVNYQ